TSIIIYTPELTWLSTLVHFSSLQSSAPKFDANFSKLVFMNCMLSKNLSDPSLNAIYFSMLYGMGSISSSHSNAPIPFIIICRDVNGPVRSGLGPVLNRCYWTIGPKTDLQTGTDQDPGNLYLMFPAKLGKFYNLFTQPAVY